VQVSFEKMTHLKLSFCKIDELSKLRAKNGVSPLSSLVRLKSLNLSHNNIKDYKGLFSGLTVLANLEKIDLSYNSLTSMPECFLMLGNIKSLLLTSNKITHSSGIDRLWSLEKLSLDGNQICTLKDVVGLSKLPCLMDLDVKENPLCKVSV